MEQIARRNLDDCRLRAPFSGIIAEKSMETGENVAPGMPVARLVTASSLVVRISVPEAEMRSVRTGQKADVAVTAIGGEKIAARVVEKGVVANPLSRTYEVRLKLENTDKEVLPGMVTEVFLHPYKTASGIHYVIPAHVVQIDEHNRSFVWCVKDGKARRRFIVCDEYSAGGVIVTSGLSANDSIIVEGQQKVCEGTEVEL
ncbi:efflux RND transporter periplasmic adaptor subunit [Leyella lascolaii]|uniref:efflux RND transporter periplasmic adaptor subunit n=1 Tax=Leyella lascolaii TaxID=1776379 RepID=UPI001F1468A0|nr:efflux RND transporter periplasmic adaptor subunit [Leyella lascolaii]